MSDASVPGTDEIPLVRRGRLRRVRNALAAGVLGTVLALVAGELFLRYAVAHRDSLGVLGAHIRRPENFADGDSDDDYWKLHYQWQDPATVGSANHPDPVTGWTGSNIEPGTYEHANEPVIRGRRLVLLYGDSFAQCNTPPEECFQTLLDESEFGAHYCLLNYGVGGHGLDQMYLLLEHSIDRFADRDPIVIVSVMVESDLDRSVLSFRDWPKPRLDVIGGELVSRGPVTTDVSAYLAAHPVSIKSYLWRYLLFNPSPWLRRLRMRLKNTAPIVREKRELNRRILVEIERSLARRRLRHFFLVFHSEEGALHTWDAFAWQEAMVRDVCRELGTPLVDTRDFLAFAAGGSSARCAELYGHSGNVAGHHNAAGNLVCFEAIRQGLRGEFERPDLAHLSALLREDVLFGVDARTRPMVALGRGARLTTAGKVLEPRVVLEFETHDPDALFLRGTPVGPTRLAFELAGGARRFGGTLSGPPQLDPRCSEVECRLAIEVDGETAFEHRVPREERIPIEIDLTGKQRIVLVASGAGPPATCAWACVVHPVLE
jgi:hypothetical protein